MYIRDEKIEREFARSAMRLNNSLVDWFCFLASCGWTALGKHVDEHQYTAPQPRPLLRHHHPADRV